MDLVPKAQNGNFNGFVIGVDDGNTYIAKMLRGSEGDWLFRTPYTSELQNGSLSYLPYILIGKLAGGPAIHDQLLALFHLFRAFGITIFIWGTNKFLTCFIADNYFRRWAMVFITFAGGLGWIIPLLGKSEWWGRMPLEFYSPETFGFLSIFTLPHLAFGRGLLLYGLAKVITFFDDNSKVSTLFYASAAFFLAGFFQPIYSALGIMLSSLIMLVKWKKNKDKSPTKSVRQGIYLFICPGLWVIYYLVLSKFDHFFRAWTNQNVITSPNPLHYLLAYGILAAVIIISLVKDPEIFKDGNIQFLLLWIIILPILAYFPSNLQRRLPDGIWTSFVVLAAIGLGKIEKEKSKVMISQIILLISLPASLILYAGTIFSVLKPTSPLFVRQDKLDFIQSVYDNDPNAVIISDFRTSNEIPAYFPLRMINGHGPEATLRPKLEMAFKEFVIDSTSLYEIAKELGANWIIEDFASNLGFPPEYLDNCHFNLRSNHVNMKAFEITECK